MSGHKIIRGLREAVAHAKAQPHPRVLIGLEAAAAGDVRGIEHFLRFVSQELRALGMSELPEPIKPFIGSLASEAERVAYFCDGFAAATKPQSKR